MIIFRFSDIDITKFLEYINWYKFFNFNVGDGLKLEEANNDLIYSYWTFNSNNHLNDNTCNIGIGTNDPIYWLNVNGTTETSSLMITDKIGVQTTNPAYALDVNEVIRATGNIITGGNFTATASWIKIVEVSQNGDMGSTFRSNNTGASASSYQLFQIDGRTGTRFQQNSTTYTAGRGSKGFEILNNVGNIF